jgi:AbrB family looped-hinge helix DNA binding protein
MTLSKSKFEAHTRVGKNGCVLIPASFRKALDLTAGEEVVLQIKGNELRITTLKRLLERAQRLVRKHVKPGVSLAKELISER